jgi:hypothetical protein
MDDGDDHDVGDQGDREDEDERSGRSDDEQTARDSTESDIREPLSDREIAERLSDHLLEATQPDYRDLLSRCWDDGTDAFHCADPNDELLQEGNPYSIDLAQYEANQRREAAQTLVDFAMDTLKDKAFERILELLGASDPVITAVEKFFESTPAGEGSDVPGSRMLTPAEMDATAKKPDSKPPEILRSEQKWIMLP